MVSLTGNVVRASGRDCFWARVLPGLVSGMGLRQVGGEGDFSVPQGGSPVAEFFSLTAEQMRERIIESESSVRTGLTKPLDFSSPPIFGRSAAARPFGVSARPSKLRRKSQKLPGRCLPMNLWLSQRVNSYTTQI